MPISIEERGEQSKICMPPYRLSERTGWTTMRISAKDLKMQSYSKANVSGNVVLFQGKRMYSIERQAATQAFGKPDYFTVTPDCLSASGYQAAGQHAG